ncbi:MAG: hypothetical protein ACLGHT_06875 [Acidimicrobiia bacterium]
MGSPEPAPAEIERLVLRSVAALVLFLLATGTAVALTRDQAVGPVSSTRSSGAIEDGSIGPLPGANLEAYIRSARSKLSGATGRRLAVVSFSRYLTEAEARALVPGARTLLVAAPSGAPRSVVDLETWAAEERQAAEDERGELQSPIPTVEDPAFATQYRRDIARLDRLLGAIDPAGSVVFGLVVEADASDLRALARKSSVRLVDVAMSAGDKITVFRGVRPEETKVANEAPTRP